jgi:hypothetical protein
MDELALLKDIADTVPLPDAQALAPARTRLTSALTAPTITAPAGLTTPAAPVAGGSGSAARRARRRWSSDDGGSTRTRRRTRRLWWSGAAVVGLAAAIIGGVALGGLEPVGVAPAKASAAEILHEAAAAARKLPDTPPRPDQFVYTKTERGADDVREAWLSADGTHDGLIMQLGDTIPLPGCRDGRAAVTKGPYLVPGVFEECEPHRAYRGDLPTDADSMRQYLMGLPGSSKKTNLLGENILSLVGENYLRPASLAALFEAVAQLDGLTFVEHAQDGAGRSGVGVSWTHFHTITLVFDRKTHAFLGVTGAEAVVERAVVDVAGQRPR